MKKLLVLDSNSIINRAFYGIRTLNAPDGTPTNAIYGFLNILLKLINENKPDYIMASFDLKAPTFRHKMYTEYKANRTGMPDELAAQMPVMKDILRAMNIPILELEGYEADDIIGTVSQKCRENSIDCYIATGDRDDLQLAYGGTTVILTSTKMGQTVTEFYDENAVKEKYNVTPYEFVDLKALMGDKSDNIPGVSGIGEKTASKLISEYSTIENIYEHIDELDITQRLKDKLTLEKDMAFLSKQLAKIDTTVPIEINFSDGEYNCTNPDFSPELYSLLNRLGLKSVIKKMGLTPTESSMTEEDAEFFNNKSTVQVTSADEFIESASKLGDTVAVYINIQDNKLVQAAVANDKTAYITDTAMNQNEIIAALSPVLSDKNVKKYTCGIKEAIVALSGKVEVANIAFDCAIAAYLTDPSKNYDIETIAATYLGIYFSENQSAQLSLFDEPEQTDTPGKYALAVYALQEKLAGLIEDNGQHMLYYEVELPLINVLASMQVLGFTLDTEELHRFGEMLSVKLAQEEAVIYALADEEFNINSPKQLGVILFEKLGIPGGKKTKSGYSTKADILEKLSGKYEIVRSVLNYRSYQKLKSTYCDSFGTLVNPDTHRIHSVFHQTGTVTGRISSSEPNMQNIPTRTELGRELRKMFTAKDGYLLVDADYSQIELRVLAHLSQDTTMIEAFRNNEDIHAVTASKILNIPVDSLTKEQRASAKAINFGIVYGMGEYTLSQDLGISFKQAKAYMDEYFNKYHGVRDYLNSLKQNAHETGYVKTIMNRVRYIPELKSGTAAMRGYGERIAMNTPVQGSAADIIKLAMVRVYNRLKEEKLEARLILQVHDELIIETPENEIDMVTSILRTEMENAIKLDVPLVVDMAIGKSWYDAK